MSGESGIDSNDDAVGRPENNVKMHHIYHFQLYGIYSTANGSSWVRTRGSDTNISRRTRSVAHRTRPTRSLDWQSLAPYTEGGPETLNCHFHWPKKTFIGRDGKKVDQNATKI